MAAPQLFFADLVREASTATGSGPLALAGALPGHRAFAGTVPVGALFHYAVAGVANPNQWECGTGRLLADNQLDRLSVAASSDGGTTVAFGPGLKTVALTVGAGWFSAAGAPPQISDIAGLQAALDSKQAAGSYAPVTHAHMIAQVTGLQAALDAKHNVGQAFAAGSAAAPGIAFAGAAGNGLYSPGTGQIAIASGGAERLRVTASGQVGIGTNAPGERLEVDGNVRLSASQFPVVRLLRSGVGTWALGGTGTAGDNRFTVSYNGFPALLIDGLALTPGGDNDRNLGTAALRWSTVFAASGAISTSDERDKTDIEPIPENWLDAWGAVEWQRFRHRGGRRWHVGLIAQRVHAAFAGFGIDAFAIGLLCRDAVKVGRGRKDRWGLRYDECLAIEAAWQRRELARLSARLNRRQIRKVAA